MALTLVSREAGFRLNSVSSSRGQIADRAQWMTSAAGLLSPLANTRDAIKVTESVNRVSAELIERAGPVVAAAINRWLVPVAQIAFDKWPVRTGLSKSQLSLNIEVAADGLSISAQLMNTAPYAAGIRDGETARELIFEPGLEAARRMAQDIAAGLAA